MSTLVAFLAVVVVVLLALLLAASRATRLLGDGSKWPWGTAAAVVLLWLATPGALAYFGALDNYSPLPTLGLAVMLLLTGGTAALAFTRFGQVVATSAPLAALVGYQAFRLPLELVLHRLYSDGVIPEQMTYTGRNFDILTGLSAIVIGIAIYLDRCPRWLLGIWNTVGLVLLTNVVVVAVLSTPVPFRYFLNDPPNLLPSTFPYVWLPTFLVQAALFGHLIVFRALRRDDA